MSILILFATIVLLSFGVLVIVILSVPEGYEDSDGFHLGRGVDRTKNRSETVDRVS